MGNNIYMCVYVKETADIHRHTARGMSVLRYSGLEEQIKENRKGVCDKIG